MDPAFAQEVIAYLKKDPETAKKSLEAAQMLMTVRTHPRTPPPPFHPLLPLRRARHYAFLEIMVAN